MNWNEFKIDEKLLFLMIISISIGIHGIMHYMDEIYFDFNPLAGKWTVYDKPIR